MQYLIGSYLLGLTENKDLDYLVITDDTSLKRKYIDGIDYFYQTQEYTNSILQFKEDNLYLKLVNFQYDKDVRNDDFPEYHILDYRSEIITILKKLVNEKIWGFSRRIFILQNGKKFCLKNTYLIAYNLFILENNSPIITEEQKTIIQKIHDRQMPLSYLDELETRINKL